MMIATSLTSMIVALGLNHVTNSPYPSVVCRRRKGDGISAAADMRHALDASLEGTTIAAPSDPRLKYGDVFIKSFDFADERDIYENLRGVLEEDVVWIASWLNQVKNDNAKCREIHGLGRVASYMSTLMGSSPDIVLQIRERVLYRKPDDSSFLVIKATATGNLMLTISLRNALNVGRRLFSRNGFFGRIFRAEKSSNGAAPEEKGTTRVGDSTPDDPHHRSPTSGPSPLHGISYQEENVKQGVITIPSMDESASHSFAQQQLTESAQNRKRKKAPRQQSMMHRNFLNFRKKKILPEEVELALEGSSFELQRAKRTGSYIVSLTLVCHINPQHRVYKVESFRHLDWRQFHR